MSLSYQDPNRLKIPAVSYPQQRQKYSERLEWRQLLRNSGREGAPVHRKVNLSKILLAMSNEWSAVLNQAQAIKKERA
jgi:hypothetical protein